MSWLAWLIAAVVLCPLWWRVANEAQRLRGSPELGGLARTVHAAASATAILIAFFALAAIYAASGAHTPDDLSIGLF